MGGLCLIAEKWRGREAISGTFRAMFFPKESLRFPKIPGFYPLIYLEPSQWVATIVLGRGEVDQITKLKYRGAEHVIVGVRAAFDFCP